ncbi:MAG: hypothetical protein Q7U10_08525 [Thermodesulfovibrionia bacterium]|nr:hypothetical protein [Thermodesulfovibrionia bacterium]
MCPEETIHKIPAYNIVEKKIRQIDRNIMVFRVFFIPVESIYRFLLIRKDRMCTVAVPKSLLEELKDGGTALEEELAETLLISIDNDDFWTEIR